jgi:DNA-directed RNA polymerase specialized sigma24 family protein
MREQAYTRKAVFIALTYWYQTDYEWIISNLHISRWDIERVIDKLLVDSEKELFHYWTQGYETKDLAKVLHTTEESIWWRKWHLSRKIAKKIK